MCSCRTGRHISIHALLAESDPCNKFNLFLVQSISIHALLAESDISRVSVVFLCLYFYPRSPCGERPPKVFRHCTTYLFLSTLSLRRATLKRFPPTCIIRHFYPRSPCGERRQLPAPKPPIMIRFLSTLSLRRATYLGAGKSCDVCYFYPRSPCGERLIISPHSTPDNGNFYPRSPCGERQ